MKKAAAVFLALIMTLVMTACGGNSGGGSASAAGADMTVSMSIDFPDGSETVDVEAAELSLPGGSSVQDALDAYAGENDVEVVMDETSDSPYVTSIGGVEADDDAGWVYEVNGEMVMEAASDAVLNDGDEVTWEFQSWQ